jgi:hypothetical protein
MDSSHSDTMARTGSATEIGVTDQVVKLVDVDRVLRVANNVHHKRLVSGQRRSPQRLFTLPIDLGYHAADL